MDPTPKPQIILGSNPEALSQILFEGQAIKLTPKTLSVLVPARVREIARNPDKIEIQQLRNEKGEIALLVVEKDYSGDLSDAVAYVQWMEDKKNALKAQAGRPFKTSPDAPTTVNRLHARFYTEINEGKISLQDRILMTCILRLHPLNKKALYVGDFDGEQHKGIGQDFYKNTLPAFAKSLGLRFIIGENRMKNYSFFKDTLKRFALDEIKPELQELFAEHKNDFLTIQFLYPEDEEKYVGKK